MLLTQARKLVKTSSLWVNDATFTDDIIDRAIQMACNDMVEYTGCIHETREASLPSGSSKANLAEQTGLGDLLALAVDHCRIGYTRVKRVDFHFLRRRHEAYPVQTGQPQFIAPEADDLWHWWPLCDQAYAMTLSWRPAFVDWTPGQTSDVELNIPSRHLRAPLWTGAAAAMVYGQDNGNNWAQKGLAYYFQFREELARRCGVDSGIPRPHPYNGMKNLPGSESIPRQAA